MMLGLTVCAWLLLVKSLGRSLPPSLQPISVLGLIFPFHRPSLPFLLFFFLPKLCLSHGLYHRTTSLVIYELTQQRNAAVTVSRFSSL